MRSKVHTPAPASPGKPRRNHSPKRVKPMKQTSTVIRKTGNPKPEKVNTIPKRSGIKRTLHLTENIMRHLDVHGTGIGMHLALSQALDRIESGQCDLPEVSSTRHVFTQERMKTLRRFGKSLGLCPRGAAAVLMFDSLLGDSSVSDGVCSPGEEEPRKIIPVSRSQFLEWSPE